MTALSAALALPTERESDQWPPAFDPVDNRGRNVVERGFADTRQWR